MKKVIKLALVLMCAMCSTSLYAQKFARINLQEVIFSMPEFAKMQTDLESFSKELGEQLEYSSLMPKKIQRLEKEIENIFTLITTKNNN